MKTLIYGAGPIGQWLALRLHQAGSDVTLLARNQTHEKLQRDGVVIVDGLTGERMTARVALVDQLGQEDRYDLVVVAMQRRSRIAVCPELARNPHSKNVLFLGNDVEGFHRYLDHLPEKRVLLGFPGAGGGWRGDDLVIMDREDSRKKFGEIFLGEIDGINRQRTRLIGTLFESAGIKVSYEKDIDGWLKYHFAFMGPTVGVVLMHGGDLEAVAGSRQSLRKYIRGCREAGDVLRAVGYKRRQPAIFNLYYWLPEWVGVKVFRSFFRSRKVEVAMGLHASEVGDELLEMMEEFAELKAQAGFDTPNLDELISCAR